MRISDWSSDVCSSDLISDASRIDAEMSRATLEKINMAELVDAVIGSRANRTDNSQARAGPRIELRASGGLPVVSGVGTRMERVIEILLDNAETFSQADADLDGRLDRTRVVSVKSVCDRVNIGGGRRV